jgi:hypothetical protein
MIENAEPYAPLNGADNVIPFPGSENIRMAASEAPDVCLAEGVVVPKDAAAFLREYQPISYTIGGILPSNSLYFLTSPKFHGKTIFMLAGMFAVALNRPELLGVDEVEPGHVAYIALENPTDTRMKMSACAYCHNIMLEELAERVTVIDQRTSTKDVFEQLKLATQLRGPLQAVFYDTFQAGFTGATGFNDNLDMRNFTLELRTLTQLPGSPSVLVAAHPTKNAGEGGLEPYGGGAVLNEADGNLTLWKDERGLRLHFLNKLRGPNFDPRYFRIEMLCTDAIVDNKGRQIELPVCRPMSEETVEQRQAARAATNADILRSFADDPTASERDRAGHIGVSRSTLQRRIRKLAAKKFLEEGADGQYRLAKKGREEISHIGLRRSPSEGLENEE